MIKTICKHCGNEFEALSCEIKRGGGIYCSRECFYKDKTGKSKTTGNHKQVKVNCANCGKELIRKNYRANGRNYCDAKCQMEYEYKNGIRDKFAITKKANKETRRLCKLGIKSIQKKESRDALKIIMKTKEYRDKLSGENSHSWKGGVNTLYMAIRNCFEYRQWRSDVFTRDNYTCQECGDDRGGNLNVHHIKSFISILNKYEITTLEEALICEALWNINNGITLCEECHKEFHR